MHWVFVFVVVQLLSHIQPLATPWIVVHKAPAYMGFYRKEYWSGLPFPSPGDLPGPGIESKSPALAGEFFTTDPPRKTCVGYICRKKPNITCCCCCCHFSRVRLCVTTQTAAHQAPPSLGFFRQEFWSGLPFPSPNEPDIKT